MISNEVMFSSKSCEYPTPVWLVNRLMEEFGTYTLDVAADCLNTKAPRFFSIMNNGLLQDWAPERCWCNPPYGKHLSLWVMKAYEESLEGAHVTCLLPAWTDKIWFNDIVLPHANRIIFIRKRIKFEGAKQPAPFPSLVAIFDQQIVAREITSMEG